MRKIRIYKHLLMFPVFSIFILLAVASASTPSTTSSESSSNKSTDVTAYTLSKGERLATFIETQNSLNEYSKYENVPTSAFYKELFDEFEDFMKEGIEEDLKEITEDDIIEFQQEYPNLTINDFTDLFSNISFFYIIEYNRNTRVWHLELIGRSTTMIIDFSNTRREEMSYTNVIPYIKRWMKLNNVPSVDNVFRVYINDIDEDTIPELWGIQLN